MTIFKLFLKRFLIVAIPLLLLYGYAQLAFETNRKSEHPTDVGLGIALLLGFIFLLFFIGFAIDTIIRIKKKQYRTMLINAVFLLIFLLPILYIKCQMTTYCEECFCRWIIENVIFKIN